MSVLSSGLVNLLQLACDSLSDCFGMKPFYINASGLEDERSFMKFSDGVNPYLVTVSCGLQFDQRVVGRFVFSIFYIVHAVESKI